MGIRGLLVVLGGTVGWLGLEGNRTFVGVADREYDAASGLGLGLGVALLVLY